MVRKVKNLIDEMPLKVFNTDKEFIQFVRDVADENNDADWIITNISEAEHYLITYCDNLELITI